MTVGVTEFWAFALVFTRIGALLTAAPLFSSRAVPHTVKAGLAALLAIALTPSIGPRITRPPGDMFTLIAQMAAEAAVGLSLGFLARMVFAAIEIAGSFMDLQIGFSMMNVMNPLSEQHSAVIGTFLSQLGLTLFLLAGGHLFLLGTVIGSYGVVGPGAAHFAGDGPGAMTHMAGQMLALAFRLALPAMAIMLVVDVAFAIVARTVPQINIMIVGLPLKIIVGLFTVSVILPGIAVVVGQLTPTIASGAQMFLQAAR